MENIKKYLFGEIFWTETWFSSWLFLDFCLWNHCGLYIDIAYLDPFSTQELWFLQKISRGFHESISKTHLQYFVCIFKVFFSKIRIYLIFVWGTYFSPKFCILSKSFITSGIFFKHHFLTCLDKMTAHLAHFGQRCSSISKNNLRRWIMRWP